MKLLITGAGGFLGSRLSSFYRGKYEVWGVGHEEMDLADAGSVREAVKRFGPDVVIHCAAVSDVGACTADPARSFAVNVKGAQFLAQAGAAAGAKFVLCSSDQVYFKAWQEETGESREAFLLPHREEEALSPIPVYGQHKLLAEELCRCACPDTVCLRLTWMYDRLTKEERCKGRKNLGTILLDGLAACDPAAQGKQKESGRTEILPAFSATDYRSVTDVNEVVRNMEAAWQLPPGVYNFGSFYEGSIYELVRSVLERMGSAAIVRRAETGSLRNLCMDTAKARAQGIRFMGAEEGLEKFLNRMKVKVE